MKAYRGDNKTLLAFDFTNPASAANLAGFTIACQPPGQPNYYLLNELQFQTPGDHAQVDTEPARSTVNAPLQTFRWVHFPAAFHQGTQPPTGDYTYTVTPRYFNAQHSMLPMDPSLSASVTTTVAPFVKNGLTLGFTRGYMQSEAFTHHFGPGAKIKPAGKQLEFDTSAVAGTDAQGKTHTFLEEYNWMGATAREQVFNTLNAVIQDPTLQLDMFAYDLDEPDLIKLLLPLAQQGRLRVILDNAALHTSQDGSKPEDQFTALFQQTAPQNGDPERVGIVRGHFTRFSHSKIFIVSRTDKTTKSPFMVLTGSTNFSVTGLYVNANHVLVFDDPVVAAKYAAVFELSWTSKTATAKFTPSPFSVPGGFDFQSAATPPTHITFSPHTAGHCQTILGDVAARIATEGKKPAGGSILFAVMDLTGGGPVLAALHDIHQQQTAFSYGISDTPDGVALYAPGTSTGVLVTGKPGKTVLPPPFDQVPSPPDHEIHDKFVVCGFNQNDAVVYCGSSNLSLGGETENGDNLLAIQDSDVATAFAIEALLLVDHYSFLDKYTAPKSGKATQTATSKTARILKQPRSKSQAALDAGMFLAPDDSWTRPYFDPKDLHYMERQLFA